MSNIEWTDETWNPVVGCTPVSPGCLNCYAATMARRLEAMGMPEYQPVTMSPTVRTEMGLRDKSTLTKEVRIAEVRDSRAVFTGLVRCLPERLEIPLRWKKPRKIFVNSMSDLFHEDVPFEFIDRVFAVMALCPRYTFQVLTKRPERMAEYLSNTPDGMAIPADDARRRIVDAAVGLMEDLGHRHLSYAECAQLNLDFAGGRRWPLPNVWLGTSVEDQSRAEERIPHLLRCPAAVRFLSVEPMLGPVDLSAFFGGQYVGLPGDVVHSNYNFGIDWVICGGESGSNARPFDMAWARSLRDQCRVAGVPFFMKQLGGRPLLEDHAYCRTCSKWDHADEWNLVNKSATNHESADGFLEHSCGTVQRVYTGVPQRLNDPKGGDMVEWPEDLRVREMPSANGGEQ